MPHPKLVILTGAGISAESGLHTFRDSGGLWEGYRVEDVATPMAWARDPGLVLEFYNQRRRDVLKASPNAAHLGLAALQDHFDVQVITQNIDDLHERAGSRKVLHLHGEILKMRSERNEGLIYPVEGDMIPGALAGDGAPLRPFIVWFHEPVPMIEEAARLAAEADIFAVIGTSLVVYPAAGLLDLVDPMTPVFVIDRNIPRTPAHLQVKALEMTATAGVTEMSRLLMGL
jgi:NAD-dependent deacetylase